MGGLRSPYLSRFNFYFPAKLEVMDLLKWWTVFFFFFLLMVEECKHIEVGDGGVDLDA